MKKKQPKIITVILLLIGLFIAYQEGGFSLISARISAATALLSKIFALIEIV